jgi:hypothetical protein
MNISLTKFQVMLTLAVASVYLIDYLKPFLPVHVHDFIKKHRDIILGVYYILLAYNLFNTYVVAQEKPRLI